MSNVSMGIQNGKKTVLVVDDAPANIHVVNEILRDAYKVRVATSGAKGIELAGGSPAPDLILLDVIMPGMDGYEVCTRLKASPATCDIPVIFLTGQTESSDETRGFEVGAVDYIHKPFSPAVVVARVQTHLALRETRELLQQQLRTIRQEMETARNIQMSILPQTLPETGTLDIAASYIPMTSVAGDFYDFAVIDEHKLGVLVADVSGHGMPAALIASMLKIAFSAQAGHARDPVQVLVGLNSALYGKFQGHYVTAAYVVIDTQSQTLCYAGAGHPPILLRDGAAGTVRSVMENGLFLGFFENPEYSAVEVPFRKGDCLLLYTDGIPEMMNASEEQFGEARLEQYLKDNAVSPAAGFAAGLIEHLNVWSGHDSGGEPDDDVTLVAIHFLFLSGE